MFRCTSCGEEYSLPIIVCPRCGGLVRPVFDWRWEPVRRHGIWGFSGALPDYDVRVSLGEAWTPVILSNRLFPEGEVYFKDEGRNPTGSFRDRAAAIIVSHATAEKYKTLILASDGNMGVSVSAYSARAGLKTIVYVPKNTDPEKILLMKAYGAKTIIRDKELDDLLVFVEKEARKKGYYNASSTYNTLSIEGLKTIAYEIYLDIGVPDKLYLPLGSGLTLLSIYLGFRELLDHGLIDHIPLLVGVEMCGNPVYAVRVGFPVKHCREKPLPGLSYTRPPIIEHVSSVLEKYGDVIVVSRKKMLDSAKKLSRYEGLFVEPSSAVALAGALENEALEGRIVILLTGHGLKGPALYLRGSRLRETRIFPGTTKHLILETLSEYPGLTGYEVWKKLGLRITPQAVYQHLRELEEHGYISSKIIGDQKRYYLAGKARRLLG